MKRLHLVTLFILMISFGVSAQNIDITSLKDLSLRSYKLHNKIEAQGKIIDIANLDGSPYWNEDYHLGKIIIKEEEGIKTTKAFVRYRIFDDIFEVKKSLKAPESSAMELERTQDIVVLLDHKKFVLLRNLPIRIRGVRNGYAIVMLTPNKLEGNAILYKRMSQTFTPARAPKGPYDSGRKASLDREDYYFVKIDNRLYQITPHKRKAYKDFPNHQKELKDFIKENRLKFRNDEQDEDMIQLVKYYNSL